MREVAAMCCLGTMYHRKVPRLSGHGWLALHGLEEEKHTYRCQPPRFCKLFTPSPRADLDRLCHTSMYQTLKSFRPLLAPLDNSLLAVLVDIYTPKLELDWPPSSKETTANSKLTLLFGSPIGPDNTLLRRILIQIQDRVPNAV